MTAASSEGRQASERSLVLVAGSGRSGTSVFSGMLQRLGYYVPQPEVKPDETNPRGFAESQWVVDFHTAALRDAGVQVSDARPHAWAQTAAVGFDGPTLNRLRSWLREQYAEHDHVIIKDPRLSWFLPLWRRCAEDLKVTPRFVTMLRHPAAVINSKSKWYGTWQGDVSRAAGWLNMVLFTERATREAPRAFVRYDDLLDDWTVVISRVGRELDLGVVSNATAGALRNIHEFVDPGLSRSSPTWDDVKVPEMLRDHAEHVWGLLSGLADEGADVSKISKELDLARAAYIELYEDAEAIAQSSITHAKQAATAQKTAAGPAKTAAARKAPLSRRLIRKVPKRYRKRIRRMLGRPTAAK